AKKTDKVKVEIRLETEEGTPFPNVPVQVRGTKDFRFQGNLDRDGILCVEVPRGKLDVSLVDTPQLEQRLLAARLVQAIQSKQLDRIPPLLVMARADFRALEKSVQDLDRGTFDSVASRIRVLFTQAGRQGEVEPLLCLLETATYSGDRPTSMRIHAAQTAPFHDGILGFFVDSIQAGSLEAEWALYPVWDDRTTTPTGTRCLSPLGKTASVCFPASAGRWMLVACIPGVAAAAKEFTVHDKDAVLAPDMPLDELDPTAFVGVVRKCGQWLAALDSEDRLDEDPSWSALATTASQILDAAGQMGGMRFAIHGPSEGSVRACLASDDSGWAILDWSDSALASGQIVWKCDSSAPSRDPIFVLQHWLDTATSAPERVSAAIPDASNGRDLSSGSLRIVEARSATSKSPTTNAGMVTLWYRMVARACKRPRPLRDLDVGLQPISAHAIPQGIWKEGSHRVDLALAIANQSEGILGGFSSREWEPGTKVNLDGCTLDSWSRPQGEWTEHVLFESSAMEGIRSLVDNRRVSALERLSLLLGEIGSLLEQGKLRSHIRHTDSTDPRENWSARGPVSCSSLDVVGFTTKSPSCKLVASTWKPGTLEEHPSTNLPQASTRTGMIQARFQTFAGLPLPLDTVELVREGNVVWKGSAVEGKVRIDNLPLDGYLFRVTFQGRPLDLSVAWEPSDTTDPAQICRLPFSLEA
ncbi:MAG TPA: hypothetical protein PKY05_09230, partial [Fibrobacteria bacterium]|nr:hypothetical protein [Fibrobacteria bacterium]